MRKEPQTAEEFLKAFTLAIVRTDPMDRQPLVKEWATKLKQRDAHLLDYVRTELAEIKESNESVEALLTWLKDASEKEKVANV